jgi:M-phase inducer tyrosine phosphatase
MYGGCGVVNFDFRNMSMHQKPLRQDYFTTRPVRGSSPTATLTADLSANFHIDQRYNNSTLRTILDFMLI